jgi:hypothetical protein
MTLGQRHFQMEKSEQRFVVKFLFLKGLGSMAIHTELTAVLGSTVYSLSQIKIRRARFATGDLSCKDYLKPRRPFMFWGRPSPISLNTLLSRAQGLSRNTLVNRTIQSKRSSRESSGYDDSREGPSPIRSPPFKKLIENKWQLIC